MTDQPNDHSLSRRAPLHTGATVGLGTALAGCTLPGNGDGGDGPLFAESFESGFDWETAAHIGPEEDVADFEWAIERVDAEAADGDWSLEFFTEGDHDDGTAWATAELSPSETEAFEVTFEAWSESESFNILRNIVATLAPEPPESEQDFPAPGQNSSAVDGAPYGSLREPLHLAAGWHEYSFTWEPVSVPETLYLSLGVSVVREADATHYLDSVTVESV